MTVVTKEMFAKWSFERDVSEGCFDDPNLTKWEQLDKVEQKEYFDEAEHYLKQPRTEWPLDVLDRL